MNNKYLIFLRNVLLSGLAIVVLTLFSSCENFLKGNDVKSQLEELIAYENALTHQLIVRSVPAMGSFLSEGEKPCKLGFTTDLQFNMNKEDYVFHGFEAVCVNDPTQSRADCVEFKINEAESDPSKGIYKVTVKLLKAADDILIRPVCVLIPAVVLYEPESKSPNYLNTPIVIHFNQAMDPLNVLEKDDQNNYKNISLEYLGDDIINLFEAPYFDSSKSILTITPKGGQLLEYLKDERFAYFDFDIFLKNICLLKSLDGKDYNLALKSNNTSDYSFSIRYKYAVEEVKPIQYEFLATRQEITLNNVSRLAEEDEFIYGVLDATSSGDTQKQYANRCNGIFYVYGKYYDAESGVKGVKIQENRVYSPDNYQRVNINGQEKITTVYSIADSNEAVEWIDNGDGYVTFCIKHEMKSMNGAVEVSITAMDGAGNPPADKDVDGKKVVNNFTVIKKDLKDFFIPQEYYYTISNGGNYNGDDSDLPIAPYLNEKYKNQNDFDYDEYEEKIKEFYIYTPNNGTGLCQFYGGQLFSPSDITLKCKYINSQDKEIEEPMTLVHAGVEHIYWKYNLDVKKIAGTKLTIIFSDMIGNEVSIDYPFPETNTISYIRKENNYKFVSSSEAQVVGVIQIDETDKAQYFYHDYLLPDNELEVLSGHTYKICPCYSSYNGSIFIEIPDFQYGITLPDNTLTTNIENCNIEIQKSPFNSSRQLKVKLSIDSNSWTNYDAIYADFSDYFPVPELEDADCYRAYFEKGQTVKTISFWNETLYAGEITCTFYGVKNNKCTNGTEVKFGPVSGNEYDNTPPEYDITGFSYSNQKITFTNIDDNSGPGESFILINGQKYDFTDQLEINLKDINLTPQGTFTYEVYVYDAVGNCFIDMPGSFNAQQAAISKIEKSSTTWTLTCSGYGDGKKLYIYTLNNDGSWSDPNIQKMKNTNIVLNTGYKNITLPDGSNFIKIVHTSSNEGSFSYPAYFYTGSPSDGIHDMVMPHGNSTSIVTVKSNQPVFVNTVVTDMDYDICKDWTAEQWEFCHDTLGNKYMDFTTAPLVDQKYEIPVNEITSGQCYVVIAHFANGKSDMSDVMVKP